MKKIVLLFAAAAIAASPALAQEAKKETKKETKKEAKQSAAAATKHKKKMTKEEAEAADIAQQHDNTRRAMRDALPLVLPSWSMPIFFGMHMDEKLKEGDKKPKQQ
jgi:Ni/Co efflux regulator RcnB